jgi:tetratricopeptide (TPR) repeat protein/transcriptional regulator with XRE-family HTH domain
MDSDAGEQSFAALLRTWRQRVPLSQEQLARRTGLAARTIRRLESQDLRRPRPQSVHALAEALRLSDEERALFVAALSGGGPVTAPTALPIPRQLPGDVVGFAGRAEHLRELDTCLAEPVTVIVTISGTAGVGKTALAVHWAHRVADRFPDGQLYVNLRGFDPDRSAVEPGVALRGFLEMLDVPQQRIPAGLDEQAALYRSALAGKRMLVVLDNARDATQVRPLLPGAGGCLALVTSRNNLTGLIAANSARALALDLLSTVEAHALLAARLGADRLAAEPAAVNEIIRACGHLPLALSVAAAHAGVRRGTLAALAAELRDAASRLDAFATGDPATDVRSVFSWSYAKLGESAGRLFRLLSVHPGPDFTAPAATSLAGLPLLDVRRALAELIGAHLLSEYRPGRYTFHDLLRAYAAEQALADDSETDLRVARQRLLDYYVHTASAADRCLDPNRDPTALAPPLPGTAPEDVTGRAQEWLVAEYPVLLATVELAASAGFGTHTWQLTRALSTFQDRTGRWADMRRTETTALAAARLAGDRRGQAQSLMDLTRALLREGATEQARSSVEEALALYRRIGDRTEQAKAHFNLALLLDGEGEYQEALRHARRAFDHFVATGHPARAKTLGRISAIYLGLGDYRRAVEYAAQAVALGRDLADRPAEAVALIHLGAAYQRLGRYGDAVVQLGAALTVIRAVGDRYYEASVHEQLGDVHEAAGDRAAAEAAWRVACDVFGELGRPEAARVRVKLNRDAR